MDRDLFNIDTEPLPVEDHEEIVLEYEFDGIESATSTNPRRRGPDGCH